MSFIRRKKLTFFTINQNSEFCSARTKLKVHVVRKFLNNPINVMLSVIINKSVQSDPILINDFSRLAPIISNKLNGAPNRGCSRPKPINVAMAEQKRRNAESSSNHHDINSRIRPSVSSHLSGVQSQQGQRRAEESITPNSHVLAHNLNFGPLYYYHPYQPSWQIQNHNLVYRQFCQAVLQPNLSQTCFHRPNPENQQRQVQSAASNVDESWINSLRFWEQISAPDSKRGFVFSVMSYNVLAQDLLDQHPYLYAFHRRETLSWQVRWNNLLGEIKQFSPDILCLQEVQGSHLKDYFSTLETLGYRGVYKQRTGARTDGCAIYYKQHLVSLVEHATVEYNQPNVSILDRDNVAIIAKFAPKKHPSKEFIVATTHLLYNPKRQDVRLAQTQLLLTEVERIAFDRGGYYLPIIITGDLNSAPDSAVYQFITKGKLRYENLASRSLQNNTNGPKTGKQFLPATLRITDQCQHADLIPKRRNNKTIPRSEEVNLIELKHSERTSATGNTNKSKSDTALFSSGTLTHKFHLKSVYDHIANGDMEGTTYQDEWVSVDYIFYSRKKVDSGRLTLLERYKLPTKQQLDNIKIPNTVLGSDHLSLLAKFKLKV